MTKKYIINITMLTTQALNNGLVLEKKMHRVIKFNQKEW